MSAPAVVGAALGMLAGLAVLELLSSRARIPGRAPVPPIPHGPEDVPPLPSREPLEVRAGDRYQMTIVAPRTMDPQALIEAMERAGFLEIDVSIAQSGPRFSTWRSVARWGGEVARFRLFFEGVTIVHVVNVGP